MMVAMEIDLCLAAMNFNAETLLVKSTEFVTRDCIALCVCNSDVVISVGKKEEGRYGKARKQ